MGRLKGLLPPLAVIRGLSGEIAMWQAATRMTLAPAVLSGGGQHLIAIAQDMMVSEFSIHGCKQQDRMEREGREGYPEKRCVHRIWRNVTFENLSLRFEPCNANQLPGSAAQRER